MKEGIVGDIFGIEKWKLETKIKVSSGHLNIIKCIILTVLFEFIHMYLFEFNIFIDFRTLRK